MFKAVGELLVTAEWPNGYTWIVTVLTDLPELAGLPVPDAKPDEDETFDKGALLLDTGKATMRLIRRPCQRLYAIMIEDKE